MADIHAFLDNMKAPIELVKHRAEYYQRILIAVMQAIGVPTDRMTFVLGSSYQLTEKYNFDTYRLAAMVTEHDAKKAGAEVVKQVASPLLSGLLYPGLQALDEQYLDVDFQFGGIDQRKIFTFAEQYLPRLGYAKRSHLMNAMVPGMNGSKMSSSDVDSKIDFLDSVADIKRKIKAAYCMPGEVENNGVLAFVGAVLMPIIRVRYDTTNMGIQADPHWVRPLIPSDAPQGTMFTIARPEKYGGALHYSSFEELESDFKEQKVHPQDLKSAVTDALITLLAPVHEMFEKDESFRKVKALAYPEDEPKEVKKKVKKGMCTLLIQSTRAWRHSCSSLRAVWPRRRRKQLRMLLQLVCPTSRHGKARSKTLPLLLLRSLLRQRRTQARCRPMPWRRSRCKNRVVGPDVTCTWLSALPKWPGRGGGTKAFVHRITMSGSGMCPRLMYRNR